MYIGTGKPSQAVSTLPSGALSYAASLPQVGPHQTPNPPFPLAAHRLLPKQLACVLVQVNAAAPFTVLGICSHRTLFLMQSLNGTALRPLPLHVIALYLSAFGLSLPPVNLFLFKMFTSLFLSRLVQHSPGLSVISSPSLTPQLLNNFCAIPNLVTDTAASMSSLLGQAGMEVRPKEAKGVCPKYAF